MTIDETSRPDLEQWSVVTPDGADGTEAAAVVRPCIINGGRIIGSFDHLVNAQLAAAAVNERAARQDDVVDDGPYWLGFYRGTMSQPIWSRIVVALAVAIAAAFLLGFAAGRVG